MSSNDFSGNSTYSKPQRALLIAEKPDQMQQIQQVYEKYQDQFPYEIDFMAQRGHLIRLLYPNEIDPSRNVWKWENIPFFPDEEGGWKYDVIKEEKKGKYLTSQERYHKIEQALHSGKYDFVIHAGDPDREGELLVCLVLKKAGNRLPVKRFWQNDLTEKHVLDALLHLRDDETDPLLVHTRASAYGRQWADYMYGLNLTQAASLKMQGMAAVGRVKTVAQYIVCLREREIRNYVETSVYSTEVTYIKGFKGSLVALQSNGQSDQKETISEVWFETKAEAERIAEDLYESATVIQVEKKQKSEASPQLFILSSAQIQAAKMGYRADEVRDAIQHMYEAKVMTYPRTDCPYLSSDTDFHGILRQLHDIPELAPIIDRISDSDIDRVRHDKRYVDDKALQEAGHSALRPTTDGITTLSLSKIEQDAYMMIAMRFLAMFLPPLITDHVTMVCQNGSYLFRSSGKSVVQKGWRDIYPGDITDTMIPAYQEGDTIQLIDSDVKTKTSTKPKRYTSAELIQVLNHPVKFLLDESYRTVAGKKLKIGTAATQTDIIRVLVQRDHYIEEVEEGKTLRLKPTDIGMQIIDNLEGCDLTKVDVTGSWEMDLEDVRTGKMTLEEYEQKTKAQVISIIEDIKNRDMKPLPQKKKKFEEIGICPSCGNKLLKVEKGYFCTGYKESGCQIRSSRVIRGRELTTDEFLTLIHGKSIEKEIIIAKEAVKRTLAYDFDTSRIYINDPDARVIGTCPKCGGDLVGGHDEVRCKKGDLTLSRHFMRHDFTDEEILSLFHGDTISATLYSEKTNKTWIQMLKYDLEKREMIFYDPTERTSDVICPFCKAQMTQTDTSYKCHCGFRFYKEIAKHTLTEEEISILLSGKETDYIRFYSSKNREYFNRKLKLNRREKQIKYVNSKKKT